MTKHFYQRTIILAVIVCGLMAIPLSAYYTTSGQNTISLETGEIVQLRGLGLGGWLLPEGYMWGSGKLNRPRHFEAAIEELIGPRNARKFWDLYYENFMTREDVAAMKSWGVNTLRVPLLASMIQPREGQPASSPYRYDEHNFAFIDDFVDWCEELEMGVIWDLHGAPGGQNAENISDSDGVARLWTEKDVYWPLTLDLWDMITKRYADKGCIVGYDLLNEPLLARYEGVDPGLLRELYVLITARIRETDSEGIIFVEGDDWAQDFTILEPLDWDPHLVLAFHSYPPTFAQYGLERWDDFRERYNMPLWHGETGEQDPPWELYRRSTEFLQEANVGWNWWTHKKFEMSRQPWRIHRTSGFDKIIAYWNDRGEKPSKWQAKKWLFEQAKLTNSRACQFLPGMVRSLVPLDPSESIGSMSKERPELVEFPDELLFKEGYSGILTVIAKGYPLAFQWFRNGVEVAGADSYQLELHALPRDERVGNYEVMVFNELGSVRSPVCKVSLQPFEGVSVREIQGWAPAIDGIMDPEWLDQEVLYLEHSFSGEIDDPADLSAWARLAWDSENLYLYMRVTDDVVSSKSSVDYLKDGVEIYIDTDNSKSKFYTEDEFQLRVVLDEVGIYSDIGHPLEGALSVHLFTELGYDVELALPWSKLNRVEGMGEFLGLDIHINDNDGRTRQGKLAWHCERDIAYRSPQNFGTVRLVRATGP